MKTKIFILIISLVLGFNLAFADTVYLKSGKKVEGKIVKKTDKDVFVETPETTLLFSYDMIERIQENETPAEAFNTNMTKRKVYTWGEIDELTTYYYRHPDSKKLIPLLEFLLTLDDKDFWELEEPHQRAYPIIHFLSTAFQGNRDLLDDLTGLLNKSNDFQKEILNKIIFETRNYKSVEPVNAETFDLVWAEFFATGKRETILKLINALGRKVAGDNPYKDPDLGVLIWSLSANIRQHPLIKQICEEELKNRTGVVRKRLREAMIYSPEIIMNKNKMEAMKSMLGGYAPGLKIGPIPGQQRDWFDMDSGK